MEWLRTNVVAALAVGFCVAPASAEDEDDELVPGLLARFSAVGRTVERFDAGLSYDWGSASPDPRLPRGPFLAQWTGLLLVRQPTKYQFHAWLHGDVTVVIDGQTVLTDQRKSPGWVSGAVVDIKTGERELDVSFRSRQSGGAMKLFWSSDAFPLEPIPEHLLFQDDVLPDISITEKGRREFVGHRCNRCHRREGDPRAPPAPDLTHLAGALSPEWICDKVLNSGGSGGKMPRFDFSNVEAAAITSFLLSVSEKPKLDEFPGLKPNDPALHEKAGEVLFRSVGCAGCHAPPGTAASPASNAAAPNAADKNSDRFHRQPFAGGDVSEIGSKRSLEWLFTWLGDPARLNADHQMPIFKLSATERAQLATALSQWKGSRIPPPVPVPTNGGPDPRIPLGKQLVENARCAACHRIPGIEAPKPVGDLISLNPEWTNACVQSKAGRASWRPAFPQITVTEQLKAFLVKFATETTPPSPDVRGEALLEQKNCLGCHDRGTRKGLSKWAASLVKGDESLRGQSEALIPPSLTAVGDKLQDAALAEAASGEQPKPRLPWLRVRMPRFRHSDEEKAALVRYLKDADRIPEGAPRRANSSEAAESARPISAEALLQGQQLVGPTGFSCIACHEMGKYKPKNISLATHGSDLMAMAGRMRKEFYLRWTRSPARIVPGMEMPSYQKPVAGVLHDSIDAQLLAIWDAVNDPRFTPPTNPTAVEQFLVVGENQPARIVRDVFTDFSTSKPAYVSRAFAVGLNNGHNVLFNLDTFTLRQWTFGDFARQRTEGKSWYWDMVGVPVIGEGSVTSDWALRRIDKADEPLVLPAPGERVQGRLKDYRQDGNGVMLRYEIDFVRPADKQTFPVLVTETIVPARSDEGRKSGFERRLRVENVPEHYEPLLAVHRSSKALGGGAIRRIDAADADTWAPLPAANEALADGVDRRATALALSGDGKSHTAVLRYETELTLKRLPLPVIPVIPVEKEAVTTVPGYEGVRLPLPRSIMPTSIGWTKSGTLAFTSLKGHVYLAKDTNNDGVEDTLSVFEEGLAAPYGLIADGDDLLVAHKPEVLRLRDTDGDGRADERSVFATGWGYEENYHDWTCGFAKDAGGNLFVGLGSDYAQPNRSLATAKWRGKVLRISPEGNVTPFAHAFRYPTGLAFDAAGRLFVSDNQGVQNTFNELNHVIEGASYGVPSRHEEHADAPETQPAIQIPHPWTRSVNGIAFLPAKADREALGDDHPAVAFSGHGLGCEYDTRFLVRFTVQQVGNVVQGAVYPFSLPEQGAGGKNLTGPLSIAVAANGDIVIGSVHDSGWLGGLNTGDLVRLRPAGKLPNGIVEMRAVPKGFELRFLRPVDYVRGGDVANYTLTGYTRAWKGAYATPDSGRHTIDPDSAIVSRDGKRVTLVTGDLREGHVYELDASRVAGDAAADFFPATAHYTLHRKPK